MVLLEAYSLYIWFRLAQCVFDTLLPLLFVLISCSAALALSPAISLALSLFFFFLPPLTLCSLFVHAVIHCLVLFTTEALSQTMALLSRLLWPTECATVGLSGGYTEYPQFSTLTAGQAGHAERIRSSNYPICLTFANAGLGFMNG